MVITDVDSARRRGRGVVDTVARALVGCSFARDHAGRRSVAVVVRDRGADEGAVAAVAAAIAVVAAAADVATVVHGHPRLVGALGLDGCHLPGAMRAHVRKVRLQMPPTSTLTLSMHPSFPGERLQSCPEGIDAVTWSPIFSPHSKVDARPVLGTAALGGHGCPVIALGGVDADTAAACINAGASGVAVIGAVMGATDPARAFAALAAATGVERVLRRPIGKARAQATPPSRVTT